ncbi:hypothetical protein lerEdw1_017344 [Lerista edwardsae]|nr:hypothetical protein lerEdw1_017344 [Lerista edwardsae]
MSGSRGQKTIGLVLCLKSTALLIMIPVALVPSLGKVLVGSCSCEVRSLEEDTCPTSEEQKEIPPITWHLSKPPLLKSSHLNSKGLELTDIILVHLYMKSMNDFAVINSVYMTVFDLCPPAR